MYTNKLITEKDGHKQVPAKRVDIVKIQLVKESSLLYKNRSIHCPRNGFDLMRQFLGDVDREYVVVLCLDTKNQPTSINVCHIGSLNSSLIHPREVFKPAVLSNAASIMIGHNHPSGNSSPSDADISMTKRLVAASEIIGIKFLDHIVMGDGEFVSLKEEGYC